MALNTISVVIPTYREKDDGNIPKIAAQYPQVKGLDYWIVDTETDGAILDKINRPDFHILNTTLSTRAERLNLGAKKSNGQFLVFHHPRSLIPAQALLNLQEHLPENRWGGFSHQFDAESLGLKITSLYSNKIRPKLFNIVYLDHCIFADRKLFDQEIPAIPIFEDTELSKILYKSGGQPLILQDKSITSSIRFQKNGFLKQAILNQIMKLGYHLGSSRNLMNKLYEKDLDLNGKN